MKMPFDNDNVASQGAGLPSPLVDALGKLRSIVS